MGSFGAGPPSLWDAAFAMTLVPSRRNGFVWRDTSFNRRTSPSRRSQRVLRCRVGMARHPKSMPASQLRGERCPPDGLPRYPWVPSRRSSGSFWKKGDAAGSRREWVHSALMVGLSKSGGHVWKNDAREKDQVTLGYDLHVAFCSQLRCGQTWRCNRGERGGILLR